MDKKRLQYSGIMFGAFILFTIMVRFIDRKDIGPLGSKVGFALLNGAVRNIVGQNNVWYGLSTFFGLLVILIVVLFACMGGYELLRRRSFKKVDADIYAMAVIYVVMGAFYVLFEKLVINFRPILEDGELAASYPSSHTFMAVTVMGCAAIAFGKRIQDKNTRLVTVAGCFLVMLLAILTRFLSGAHWFTDIFGGMLLGSSLIMLYGAIYDYAFELMQSWRDKDAE
ncbi:MAG: phosphatase PAP2 family protein [Lachnospiraceae bacterium]|nr:phosphatase PAP2 family protein [Lachnospiraceae bacterium]